MSTAAPQSTQSEYVEFDEYIDYQLSKARSQIKLMDIATAAVGAAVLVLAYLFAFTLLDHWIVPGGFSTTARAVMLGLLLLASVVWIAWKVARPYFRSVNRLYAARAIEGVEPALKGNLLSLVDLSAANRPVSKSIRRAIEKRAAVGLASTDVDHAVDRQMLMRLSIALLLVVVACCLYAALSPKSLSFMRPLSTVDQAVATRTSIVDVRPGSVEILAGEHLAVMVETDGEKPEFVRAFVSWDDGQFEDFPVELRQVEDGLPQYEGLILGDRNRGIVRNMTYYIAAGDARSDVYQVSVLQPPSVTVNQVEYRFPSYMQFDNETRSTGNIDSWEGVEVTVSATANMPLQSAVVRCSDGEDLSQRAEEYRVEFMNAERTKLRARWKLELRTDKSFPRRYRFDCTNQRGQADPEPTLYAIAIRPDEQPKVVIDAPQATTIEQPSNGIIPLMISAHDDFKVRFVAVRITHGERLIREEEVTGTPVFGGGNSKPQPSLNLNYDLRLNDRFPPKSEITVRVEARDNRDEPKDGQRGVSRSIKVLITEPKPPEDVKRQLHQQKEEQREQNKKSQNPDQNKDGKPKPNQGQEGKSAEDAGAKKEQNETDPGQKQPNSEPADKNSENGKSKQTEGGTSGEEGQPNGKQSDGGSSKSKPQERGSDGETQAKPGNDGQGKPQDGGQSNRPAENDEALRDLYQKFKNEAQQPKQPNDLNQPSGKPQDGTEKTEDQPPPQDPSRTGDSTASQNPQPETKNEPKKRGSAETKDETSKGDSESKQQTSPDSKSSSDPGQDPNDPEASKKPKTGEVQPKSGADQTPESGTGEKSKPKSKPDVPDGSDSGKQEGGTEKKAETADSKPSANKKPENGSTDPNGNPGAGGSNSTKPGAGDKKTGEKPNPKEDASGGGAPQDKPTPTDKPGNQTDKPIAGEEKTTDPKEGGRPDKAEGDETGTGTASKNPKPDATQSTNPNELKRKPGEKPATTKAGDGSEAKPNTRPGAGENPDASKPNSDNTKRPEPKQPDERRSTADGADKKKPSDAKREGSPDGPNEDLKGRNPPKRSPQPSGGGAEGSGKQDDVGSRGSKDKGPGDTSDNPGQRQAVDKKTTGQPGEKPGTGSTSKSTDRKPEEPEDAKPDTTGQKPGGTGDATQKPDPRRSDNPGESTKPDSNATPDGDSAGGRGGNDDGDSHRKPGTGGGSFDPNTPRKQDPRLQPPLPPKSTGAKANEDYNRQAAEFVLRKLEDQMDRGEVDEKLLEDLGWNKQRVQEHMKWLRDGLYSRDSKQGTTSKGQFDEVLKSLDLQSPSRLRQGRTDNKRALDGVGASRQKIPAKYRKQFKQYTRGLAEGR